MPRRTVILLTESLDFDESYMDLVWRAADRQSRHHQTNLLICVGRRIDRQETDALPHNVLYGLCLGGGFDAYAVSQTIYQRATPEVITGFAARFVGLPAATGTVPLGEVPTVTCDGASAMRNLMRHLIRDHGYRSFLLVTGTPGAPETLVRLAVWREELRAAGLACDDIRVINGNFNPAYVPGLSRTVLEKVKETGADAVVVSSDLMAAALLRDLQEAGLRIPGDLALVGHDDIPLARFINPPLTTVHQPVMEQFQTVVDQALNRAVGCGPALSVIDSQMVVRGSCGCPPSDWSSESELDAGNSPEEATALDILRKLSDGCTDQVPTLRSSLALAHQRTRFLRSRVMELNLFAAAIDELEGIDAFGPLLSVWLPRLGIATWLISLASDADGGLRPCPVNPDDEAVLPEGPAWHKTLTSQPALPEGCPLLYPAKGLVPGLWLQSLERSTFVVLPLTCNGTWYGLAAMAISAEGNLMCRSVQELAASFIDREYRLREMVRTNLEARLRGQMEAEKTQSTATFIAGVAHDLSSPLGVSRNSVEFLQSGFRRTKTALEAGSLGRNELAGFLDDGLEMLSILDSSIRRLIDQVASFKRISVEVPREDRRSFGLVGFLRDILANLRPLWRHRPIQVRVEGPEDLTVTTRAAPFLDILTNLIQNSLIHAWPAPAGGMVTVSVLSDPDRSDHCRLVYADDGVGIPAEHMARLFEPYFTTREGQGGTGLGLSIIRSRVEDQLGGTVNCESEPGKGTRFIIVFPRNLPVTSAGTGSAKAEHLMDPER